MSWFKKNIKRTGKTKIERVQFPVHFELIPGKLSAQVYLHELESRDGPVACWSYVTDGLWAHRQKELVFTLGRRRDQPASDFPHDPLKFFRTIYPFAKQGQVVDVGDFSELGTSSFLGHKSIVYLPPQAFEEFTASSPTLAAILLKDEELTAVKAFGLTRVMARLGYAYRYYPFPPWFDSTRRSLSFKKTLQKSILSKVHRIKVSGASVTQEKNQIELRISHKAGQFLHKQLSQFPSDVVIALLTDLGPRVNGCLVWEPGQSPTAITPPNSDGSRLAGCFVAFIPKQAEDGGQLFEDGFTIMLTNSSWMTIRRAWGTGKAVSLQSKGEGMGFLLKWVRETYHNPVDGLAYYSESGWESYSPGGSQSKKSEGPIDLKEIVLLTSQSELEMRVDAEQLVTYTKAIEEAVDGHFSEIEYSPGQDFLIQIEVSPEGTLDLEMAAQPGISDEILRGLYDQLLDIPIPEVKQGPIKFQIVFSIWGGSGTSQHVRS
ncbi:MAG: hypothetical protein BMS9Abin02_1663 [Anaerolineae bacterium]|nr:MAG: hypothetical protein BMS9Abin02_1663 [Anaerolineae bacterium]